MLRRSLIAVTVVVLLVGGAAACGGDDDGSPGSSGSGTREPLVGTQWVLDPRASGLPRVATSAVVTAQFSRDGRLSGHSGCNAYTTTYRVTGRRLRVTEPIGSTLVACDPDVTRVEDAYRSRLPTARSFAIDGRVLTIETRGAPLVYDALDPDRMLAGDWVVTGFFRPGAITSPVPGSTLTATFASGRIAGDAGCNRYSGGYEVDGTDIAIGPLASTLRACADPAVGQQETEFLAALELAATFRVEGTNLTLLRDDGGIAVTLARSS